MQMRALIKFQSIPCLPQSRSFSVPLPRALWDTARGSVGVTGCLVPKAIVAAQIPRMVQHGSELCLVYPGDH